MENKKPKTYEELRQIIEGRIRDIKEINLDCIEGRYLICAIMLLCEKSENDSTELILAMITKKLLECQLAAMEDSSKIKKQ